jgi:NADPH:quinone reductase-like Zn-dependent oxidoreductase
MEAFYLVRNGAAETAFEKRELHLSPPKENQLRICVEAFGLNFADVMARYGYYREAPPLPAVLGYEVVGRVETDASGKFQTGQRVLAFTRFGGYASHVNADTRAVVSIPENMDLCTALGLATQGCTAYFAANETFPVRANDHVLVQGAAGGVGSLLVQLLKQKNAIVYGSVGSDEKFSLLKKLGVDHPINYRKETVTQAMQRIRNGRGLDVVFDNIGGKTFKELRRLLEPGGRIAGYGAAERLDRHGPFALLGLLFGFGFHSPIKLLIPSQTMAGINMLRIADEKPELLQSCMLATVKLASEGKLEVINGGVFPSNEIGQAHALLESRKSTGKIVVKW